jgi:chromosome segregation ATPase
LPKCENCGRLRTRLDYACACIRRKEDSKEKELPILPHERRPNAFYERQINGLREELSTAEVEIDTHLEALEISEVWNKRQKQELLDRIKELEAEVERLKKQTPQELLDEISKLKERVKELEQQTAQVEVKETKK